MLLPLLPMVVLVILTVHLPHLLCVEMGFSKKEKIVMMFKTLASLALALVNVNF